MWKVAAGIGAAGLFFVGAAILGVRAAKDPELTEKESGMAKRREILFRKFDPVNV